MANPAAAPPTPPGPLVAIEGITGVGKTYLTQQTLPALHDLQPVVVPGFSQRRGHPDLASRIVDALIGASGGDPFLRGGYLASETLLLIATQAHTYETSRDPLRAGRVVLEGRSLHSVAVYQAVLHHPDDPQQARRLAALILDQAQQWRPVPDLVVVVTDDVDTALARTERRDQRRLDAEERALHHQASQLFTLLAVTDPDRIRTLDRCCTDTTAAVDQLVTWIRHAHTQTTRAPSTGSAAARLR